MAGPAGNWRQYQPHPSRYRCYLAAIESAGVEHFFSASDRHSHPAIDAIYRDLRVSSGNVIDGVAPGFIDIALPIGGGFVGGSLVSSAVEHEAYKPDNRRKLSSAGTPERHLFVFLDVLNHRVRTPLVDLAPPSELPQLPPEITHVWGVGPARSGGRYVVWRLSVESAWYKLVAAVAVPPNTTLQPSLPVYS